MKFDEYKKKFIIKATNAGFSYENIQKCLLYAEPLINQKLPVIYNTSHLSSHVGYSKKYLKRAALYTPYFYREFNVKKKSGGIRSISEPLPSLKEIQHWVLNRILYNIGVSKYAKAYIPKKTLKEHIRFHKNQKLVVTVDITNFFGAIKFVSVERIFLELGYSALISNLLTKLCCLEGALPQGAPTSPYLSNLMFREFDYEIADHCLKNSIKYSRYADDMAFSGDFGHEELVEYVQNVISKGNFSINQEKTRIMPQNQPQLVSGVVVNKIFQVPRKERDALKQTVYFIEKFGLDSHLDKINCQKANYFNEHDYLVTRRH